MLANIFGNRLLKHLTLNTHFRCLSLEDYPFAKSCICFLIIYTDDVILTLLSVSAAQVNCLLIALNECLFSLFFKNSFLTIDISIGNAHKLITWKCNTKTKTDSASHNQFLLRSKK